MAETEGDEREAKRQDAVEVKVWDAPTRIFHWSLVACFAGAWITAEMGDREWHERFGLAVIALVLFRIVWGFVGGEFARFTSFVRGPGAVIAYVRETIGGRHREQPGHNPLGALAILALLLLLATQAGMGLFANDDILYEGPLYHLVTYDLSGTLTGWHHRLFDLILIVVGIHVLAVISYMLFLGVDLIQPMFTGVKRLPLDAVPERLRRTPLWVALLILAATAGAAYGLTLLA